MSAILCASSWRTGRGAIRSTVAALVLSILAVPVRADEASDAARRMDDRLFFVQSFDRGWEPLLGDFQPALEALPEASRAPLARVRDAATERYADVRAADGTEGGEKRAFELFETLSQGALDDGRRPEFARRCAQIEVTWAGRRVEKDDEAGARELARSALRRSPDFEPAYDLLVGVALRETGRAEAKEDYVAALAAIEEASKEIPTKSASRAKLEAKSREILGSTGEIAVLWLGSAERLGKVAGAKTDFVDGKLELRPADGRKAPPVQPLAAKIRVRNGKYAATARGDGPATFAAGDVDVTSEGAKVTVLTALPANMVVVPAVGDQDAFLIDRTEVTASELAKPGSGSGQGLPAAGVSFDDARLYATRSGKDLPTVEQWRTAAFGDPKGSSRKYPWGDTEPRPSGEPPIRKDAQYIAGTEAPEPVGSVPAGASPFGCLDMAGNVWEWLDGGWAIGGGYKRPELSVERFGSDETKSYKFELLRDPAPSAETYQKLTDVEQRARLYSYQMKGETLKLVGLRCVVPLGKPRSQP